MRTTKKSLLLVPVLMLASLVAVPAQAQHQAADTAAVSKYVQTDNALRDLWVDHIFWVRNVVVATLDGNKEAAAAAEKAAVANARAIADSIAPFYGQPGADQLFKLLGGHYGAVKQYLDAAVEKSKTAEDAATKALNDNAGAIAKFLNQANPNLPEDAVRGMLVAHGAQHVQQIQQLRDHQYTQEAQTWTAMKDHIYALSDALTAAIAKQFPQKF